MSRSASGAGTTELKQLELPRISFPGPGDHRGAGVELEAAGQGGAQAADDGPGGSDGRECFRVEVEAVDQLAGPRALLEIEEGGGGGDGPVGAGLAGEGQAYVIRGLRPQVRCLEHLRLVGSDP